MKKLAVVMLIALALPAMAQTSTVTATLGGELDASYFMDMPAGDEIDNSGFVVNTAKMWADVDFGSDLTGKLMLTVFGTAGGPLNSDGIDTFDLVSVEELWINKDKPFGVEGLDVQFGKMEIDGNLDVDNGITHCLTNMVEFTIPDPDGAGPLTDMTFSTPGEIDNTYGLSVSYKVETAGKFTLSTFEGMGGISAADEADEDTGLFSSLALQWDTDKDAFGVTGLRIVVAYEMIARDEDLDDTSLLSLGATYDVMPELTLGLEVMPMITNLNSPEDAGEMLFALNADYKIEGGYKVGLSYESYTVNEFLGEDTENLTVSRMALRGSMELTENVCVRAEYSQTTMADSDIDDIDDGIATDAAVHGSTVASGLRIGFLGTF
jgi:hypothetical protein